MHKELKSDQWWWSRIALLCIDDTEESLDKNYSVWIEWFYYQNYYI